LTANESTNYRIRSPRLRAASFDNFNSSFIGLESFKIKVFTAHKYQTMS